jgi:hypothetical protein
MPLKRKPVEPEEPPAVLPGNPGDNFLNAFTASWKAHGQQTIDQLRIEKPADYVRIALSLYAKEETEESDPLHDLTDAELAARIDDIAARLGLEIKARAPVHGAGGAAEDDAAER